MATTSAVAATTSVGGADPNSSAWPLYELFLDVPHPAASPACPKPFWIAAPFPDETLMAELRKSASQIACFAFPDYDPAVGGAVAVGTSPSMAQQPPPLNRYDVYATQNKPFQQFTFTLQVSTGQRIHGHVRRYLPPHLVARTRYDTGRRGERALVVLTRATGADLLYASILKSIEAISSQQAAMPHHLQAHTEPQKWFLHQLYAQHQHLARIYQSKPPSERGIPLTAVIHGLELGLTTPFFQKVDSNRFLLPTSLLFHNPYHATNTNILPLLRCVGVAHALRILSALLSERRIVMVSSSPTRLTACSHAALSMLAQGLLHWQHLYIPVLPPHLCQYLAAPYPYLIGLLANMYPRLDRTDGLGDVLIVHLDNNNLETRGMDANTIAQRIPDLLQTTESNQSILRARAGLKDSATLTPTEQLGQELVDVLKQDRKTLHGDSTLSNMGETAAKATKAVTSTLIKLKNKGQKFLQKSQPQGAGSESNVVNDATEPESTEPEIDMNSKSMTPDFIYTETCHNAASEEEARLAFTTFFLCIVGDMRWYLSMQPGKSVPALDRERFLYQKRTMGEGEGTPIWPLLQNFCQTQMLEEFAKARIEEVRLRTPVTPDAPLFIQCGAYHRQNNIDFNLLEIRRIARQMAQGMQLRTAVAMQANSRKTAMALTSNKQFDGDYAKSVALLVEDCRESSFVLFDVMSVIWLRIQDSKGMQWKHGYHALLILRNLLYHGPLAVIAEATDGLEKIRVMKYYENMRSNVVQQIRNVATELYDLLVDRSRLFHIRRVCAKRRWELQNNIVITGSRNGNLLFNAPFRSNHAVAHPLAGGTIVNLPPLPQHKPSLVPVHVVEPVFSFFDPEQPAAPPQATDVSQDMMGLFDEMALTSNIPGQDAWNSDDLVSARSDQAIFAGERVQATSTTVPYVIAYDATPTIVQIPPHPLLPTSFTEVPHNRPVVDAPTRSTTDNPHAASVAPTVVGASMSAAPVTSPHQLSHTYYPSNSNVHQVPQSHQTLNSQSSPNPNILHVDGQPLAPVYIPQPIVPAQSYDSSHGLYQGFAGVQQPLPQVRGHPPQLVQVAMTPPGQTGHYPGNTTSHTSQHSSVPLQQGQPNNVNRFDPFAS